MILIHTVLSPSLPVFHSDFTHIFIFFSHLDGMVKIYQSLLSLVVWTGTCVHQEYVQMYTIKSLPIFNCKRNNRTFEACCTLQDVFVTFMFPTVEYSGKQHCWKQATMPRCHFFSLKSGCLRRSSRHMFYVNEMQCARNFHWSLDSPPMTLTHIRFFYTWVEYIIFQHCKMVSATHTIQCIIA